MGLPGEDDYPSDTFSNRSDDSDSDSDGDNGPDGSCGAVSAFMANAVPVRKYVVDSRATECCFRDRGDFAEYHPVKSREGNAAEGSKFRILATSVVRKFITYRGERKEIAFNAIHTPDITANLISVSKLDQKGYAVEFGHGKAVFKRSDSLLFMEAVLLNGMYILPVESDDGGTSAWVAKSRDVPANKGTWHHRLGHIGNAGLDTLISGKHVNGLHVRDGGMDSICEDCIFGKHSHRPFDGVHEV